MTEVHSTPWTSMQAADPYDIVPQRVTRVYRTAGGNAFHRTDDCVWLHKGQRYAARQGMNLHDAYQKFTAKKPKTGALRLASTATSDRRGPVPSFGRAIGYRRLRSPISVA